MLKMERQLISHLRGPHRRDLRRTPLLGSTPPFSIASIKLPFSSATSRTQSVLPVATSKCVAHPLTCPYSSSSRSMSNLAGYFTVQEAQSCKQSSPSTAGSTLVNNLSFTGTVLKPSAASALSPTASVSVSVLEEARETFEELRSDDAPRRKRCMMRRRSVGFSVVGNHSQVKDCMSACYSPLTHNQGEPWK